MSIELSIVIPTYQRREYLRQVLLACSRQSMPSQQVEIIVAIDGSTDATQAMLTHLDTPYCLRWISLPRSGVAAARNQGAAAAQGDIILFLDDDISPAPALFAEHLAAHGSENGVVGLGQVQQLPAQAHSSWERYLCQRYEEHYTKLARPDYRPVFWDCLSGNLSVERQLLAQSGGFDPTLERHEDTALGYRLSCLGAQFVYLPQALAYHQFTRSVRAGLCDALQEGRSALQLARRHPELTPQLIHARWKRYRLAVRLLMRYALAQPDRHTRLITMARYLAQSMNRIPLPFMVQKPFYQVAYHLSFWQGVRAGVSDFTDLLSFVTPEHQSDTVAG